MASKKRKPAIELPDSYYDNAMPRKRQLPSKDDIKAKQGTGKRTVYRNSETAPKIKRGPHKKEASRYLDWL